MSIAITLTAPPNITRVTESTTKYDQDLSVGADAFVRPADAK